VFSPRISPFFPWISRIYQSSGDTRDCGTVIALFVVLRVMSAKISQATRYQAVCEVLAGGKISDVARRHGVNRATVYRWVKLGRAAIHDGLGSSCRQMPREKRLRRDLERKTALLQRRLEKKSALIKDLRKEVRKKSGPDPRPERCPKCGCEKIYKNGLYLQPLSKVIPPEVYFSRKIPVKRFVCASCHNSINLDLPGILYHWLKIGDGNGPLTSSEAGRESGK
jgi:transposase-like protein